MPSGEPADVELSHLFATGQTQRSGKTTLLEALVKRSGVRAVAFVTKRGEGAFTQARSIPPYFADAGDWEFVSSILEASRGERLKFERSWIIKASRGASTLADVHKNVRRELQTARGISEGVYTVLDAYLENVIPQIDRLPASDSVKLAPGLNVMDLIGYSIEMQSLVVRSVLEWIHEREEGVVTIIPEAWEFIPQNRGSPVKLAAERLIRKGGALGNFLWLDAQDLGALHKDIIRSCPLGFFGVQREANEIKRNLSNIPAGMTKPKAADLATLELGQFIVAHGKTTEKIYVQPAWMRDADALAIATGKLSLDDVDYAKPSIHINTRDEHGRKQKLSKRTAAAVGHLLMAAHEKLSNPTPEPEDEMSKEDVDRIEKQLGTLAKSVNELATQLKSRPHPAAHLGPAGPPGAAPDADGLFDAIVRRLTEEAPALLKVLADVPELQVTEEKRTIEASTSGKGALLGRLALFIADGFFDEHKSNEDIHKELKRRGVGYDNRTFGRNLTDLCEWGFLFREDGEYVANKAMKKNVKRAG